jgi:excisionase family DNA binding protein
MLNPWISVRTAARILGVSHNTVRKDIRDGKIAVLGYVDGRIAVLDRNQIERLASSKSPVAAA